MDTPRMGRRNLPPRDAKGRFTKRPRVPEDLMAALGMVYTPITQHPRNVLEVIPPPVVIDVATLLPFKKGGARSACDG